MAFFSRGKNKVQEPYTIKDTYMEYIKDKEEGSPYYISYNDYVKIVTSYYKQIYKYVLDGGVYNMAYKLGYIVIIKNRPRKRKASNTGIDWANTVKYKKIIRFTNDHSNYFKFIIGWNKSNCRTVNKTLYRFVPTRDFKRTLASKIKTGEYDYLEL